MTPTASKHAESLREHLAEADQALRRASHHLHNASAEAAVLPGCETLPKALESAANNVTRAHNLVTHSQQQQAQGQG